MSTSNDAFSRALKRLSKTELQALFDAMSADDSNRTPRQRLAKHVRLAWFRTLPPTEMSRVYLRYCRDGVLDISPDLLPMEQPARDGVAGISQRWTLWTHEQQWRWSTTTCVDHAKP